MARGRYEGNSLVINLTNFNGYTWFDMAGNFHSDALQVVERYTPINADTLQYEATMTDPKVFTRPWTIRMTIQRQKDIGTPRLRVHGDAGRARHSPHVAERFRRQLTRTRA